MHNNMADAQVEGFVAKYTPELAGTLQACRARMRRLVPRGCELVFDNYNALVFGYAPTDRTPDAHLSLAAYPRWVTLFFLRGVDLEDPQGLLQGTGSQVRSVRLQSAADLDRPEVLALIDQSLRTQAVAFAAAGPLTLVIKTVVAKQRPRKPV